MTSTLPYLMLAPSFVFKRADLTGCTMVPLVVFVEVTQLLHTSDVQRPVAVRLMTLLEVMRDSSWSVGLRYSLPSLMKTFSSSAVVCSNCPFLFGCQYRLNTFRENKTNP